MSSSSSIPPSQADSSTTSSGAGAKGYSQTFSQDPEASQRSSAILFVTKFSSEANEAFLKRLFSAYGHVRNVELDSKQMFARITYPSPDDADTAIAVLHLRYETVPGVSLVVLYDKASPRISQYGRRVGSAFVEALSNQTEPKPIPLRQFDADLARGSVPAPPEAPGVLPSGNNGGGGGAPVDMFLNQQQFGVAAQHQHHHHFPHHHHMFQQPGGPGGMMMHNHHHLPHHAGAGGAPGFQHHQLHRHPHHRGGGGGGPRAGGY